MSLASDQKEHVIAVILSGSGSDGAAGLKAVKAEGGITFAQDEATATYPSMPRSAVATGCVDFVLSPEKIAAEIAMRSNARTALRSGPPPNDDEVKIAAHEGKPSFKSKG